MSLLSSPSAQQLYYTESLHPLLEHPLTATMPTDTDTVTATPRVRMPKRRQTTCRISTICLYLCYTSQITVTYQLGQFE